LHAVGTSVPAVTEAAGIGFIRRRVALEIRRGQIVKQHVELHAEQIAPALAQMREERVLVFEQAVEAAIESVILCGAFIHAQQIGQRRGAKPVPVQAPFAARRKQTIKRQQPEHLFPIRSLATAPQPRGEESVQLQFAPELIAQPAGAPGARPGQLQTVQPHLHGRRVTGRRRAVLGEQGALAGLALVFIKDRDGLLPGGALRIIDLAQVEDVALHHATSDAAALDDGPRAMLLAVLAPRAALEKHAASVARQPREGRDQVATTRRFAM
jgi:hypothetical protein